MRCDSSRGNWSPLGIVFFTTWCVFNTKWGVHMKTQELGHYLSHATIQKELRQGWNYKPIRRKWGENASYSGMSKDGLKDCIKQQNFCIAKETIDRMKNFKG